MNNTFLGIWDLMEVIGWCQVKLPVGHNPSSNSGGTLALSKAHACASWAPWLVWMAAYKQESEPRLGNSSASALILLSKQFNSLWLGLPTHAADCGWTSTIPRLLLIMKGSTHLNTHVLCTGDKHLGLMERSPFLFKWIKTNKQTKQLLGVA